ncbi:carbon monoxide dehydrogenase subunit G [Streptomyces sp. NA02950]|uniref:SRPBCC family protein n=1 Tax=Streptomyces sp. NA02950 TaxID=2742137 RepID=UPI0015903D1E|nr:SRPBCC family protein [Streptomyces sp. NA02950]QKV93588.1 carbon monoxide dehydrogenase subunit G [Streptomyces sp. NA02950]
MEHEVFVPFPVGTVRSALAEPDRIARCVPGLQQDADEAAGPLAGRLRLRIGGSTITYRGALRVGERDGAFEVEGEGTEARGSGSVKLTLTITPKTAEGGTTLVCSGTVHREGRLAEFDDEATDTAAHRLLDRFASALASGLEASPITPPAPAVPDARDEGDARDEQDERGERDGQDEAGGEPRSVFDTDIPPSSLDPRADLDDDEAAAAADAGGGDIGELDDVGDLDDVDGAEDVDSMDAVNGVGSMDEASGLGEAEDEPPAEAAHARRTMIGRSTEEVDHAPPRGRYAPVPAPEAVSTSAALRWAAPAAAVVLASAVVVGRRVLRRRR